MSKPEIPLVTDQTKALTEAYAALNRNDIEGFVACFDPEIERIEPPGFATGETYQGIDAVRAHVASGRATWAEGNCEPIRFVAAGERVVVIVHVHVRLKNATDWIDAQIADVFTFRNGKVVQFVSFGDTRAAMEFADVNDK